MKKKSVLLITSFFAVLVPIVHSSQNNVPRFITNKTLDCTASHDVLEICQLTLVIEPLQSMTYYNITDNKKELRGYRATFDANGNLVTLRPDDPIAGLQPPIITDGHFRPMITVNGQMPGPTIIAHKNQILNITVYNELKNVEGISIHWHGMHQRNTQGADGVAYITQLPLMAGQYMHYTFKATPSGTYWYHAHSGAQRTDGLYGALIVKDTLAGDLYDYDLPDQHTLILQDWQRDASIDLFYAIGSSLNYWKEPLPEHPPYTKYGVTRSIDNTEVGPQPFWSAIINDKGRHFDEKGCTNIKHTSLNYFNCSKGNRYRFRLIGAQGLYGFKFSIEGHSLTVVATDGFQIKSIKDVDYVIVNTGERYDIIVNCDQQPKDYWIWAETLEDEKFSEEYGLYNPISKHRAEAVLHYKTSKATTMNDISSTKHCTPTSKCKAVNCPFSQYGDIMICENSQQFKPYNRKSVPRSIRGIPAKTLFYSFGFDGETTTFGSSIDGINFRFPAQPPLTNYKEFQKDMCVKRGCDHDKEPHCACTEVIDISDLSYGQVVEIVMVNIDTDAFSPGGTSHPIHLHGHTFYVHDVGYPEYTPDGQFQKANDNIECVLEDYHSKCPRYFITVEGETGQMKQTVRYTKNQPPNANGFHAQKDTVMVPFGGYTTIRFVVDNPGWWFFHCHIEIHQLEGMAAVVKESFGFEKPVNLTKQNKHIQSNQL